MEEDVMNPCSLGRWRFVRATASLACLAILFPHLAAAASPMDGRDDEHQPVVTAELPPLPEDVADLRFRDFYRLPVGPYGLEPSEKLLQLDGKRVRIAGYMVRRETPLTGAFMLAPFPVGLAEEADGPADDLPPAYLLALLPGADAEIPVPYQRGVFLLIGTLELGAREEPDGRIYFVRLRVERPPAATASAPD